MNLRRVRSKGGSIRGFAHRLSTGKRPKSELLMAMMVEEEQRGILKPEIYREFYQAIEQRKQLTLEYLDQAIAEGKTVAAYGASTTTTTLLYHFELGSRLSFIIDDNPIKQGTFSPGLHIPVLPSSELKTRKPDVVVILAWMYANVIIDKNQEYIAQGGKFLVPLADVKVVGRETVVLTGETMERTGT